MRCAVDAESRTALEVATQVARAASAGLLERVEVDPCYTAADGHRRVSVEMDVHSAEVGPMPRVHDGGEPAFSSKS